MYECCKFRGSVTALNGLNGRQIWKTFTIAEQAQPTQKERRRHAAVGTLGRGRLEQPGHRPSP